MAVIETDRCTVRPCDDRRAGPTRFRPPRSLRSSRWPLLGVLLAVEVIGLTVWFDSATAHRGIQWLLDLSRVSLDWVAVAAALWLLLRGAGNVSGARSTEPRRVGPRPVWPYVVAHVASFIGFAWLTGTACEGGSDLEPSLGWGVAWAATGLTVLVSWIAIGSSPSGWLAFLRRWAMALVGCGLAALAAWGAGRFGASLWPLLGRSTLWTVYALLRLAFEDTIYRPEAFVVGAPTFDVEIAPACSGFEGMGLIFVLTIAYLWIDRRALRFPRTLVLLPLGVCLMWLANTLRIAALVGLGASGYANVALGGFHSRVGWLAFIAVGLGLITLARHSAVLSAGGRPPVRDEDRWPSAPYLVPFLAWIATAMVTGAFSAGFDSLYPLRVLAVLGVLWAYRTSYGELRRAVSAQAVVIGVVAYAMWISLVPASPMSSPQATDPTIGSAGHFGGWMGLWIGFRVLGSVLTVPLAEELAFRGYLTRRLIAPDFTSVPIGRFAWPSFLVSSALFGVMHGPWLAGTIAGMLYAVAMYRRGRLGDAIVAHAVTNLLIAVRVITTGDWSLWDA